MRFTISHGNYRVAAGRREGATADDHGIPRPFPTHVYAILRIDPGPAELSDRITVKEVVTSATLAESEVVRLNALNGAKGCRYIFRLTRLYAVGTSAGSRPPDLP